MCRIENAWSRSFRVGKMLALLCLLLLLSGCWDRHELSEEGFILGWGMDLAKDGQYVGTAQITIPSKLGHSSEGQSNTSNQDGFLTLSAKGKDIYDTAGNIQLMSSRYLFAGHRQNVFIGEQLAKKGLDQVLDEYNRNPNVRLRTDIFVVKGGTAQSLLSSPQPFERIPAQEFSRINSTLGSTNLDELRYLLIDYSDSVSSMSIPAFEFAITKKKFDLYRYAGRAVLNRQAQLVGYLDTQEGRLRGWIVNQQKNPFPYTIEVNGEHRPITFDLQMLRARVDSATDGKRITFTIKLKANGFLRENESAYQVNNLQALHQLEATLNRNLKKDTEAMVRRVQREYDADIFHFGQTLHRQHPQQWKQIKPNWDRRFQQCVIHIQTDVTISKTGLTGSSLQFEKGRVLP